MKKIFGLFLISTILLVSCNRQPTNDMEEEPMQSTSPDTEYLESQFEYETELSNDIAEELTQPTLTDSEYSDLFSGDSEKLTFDDVIKNISNSNMTAELIYESRTDAKISKGGGEYYVVSPNLMYSDIRISPIDTFTEILNNCTYIETDSLDEPVIYTFIFHALDINGVQNEICVFVSRSCVKFAYNGIFDGKEYVNMYELNSYKNVCDGYDFYIKGIIPDENEQFATIW